MTLHTVKVVASPDSICKMKVRVSALHVCSIETF